MPRGLGFGDDSWLTELGCPWWGYRLGGGEGGYGGPTESVVQRTEKEERLNSILSVEV